jgi:hypothetical protein
MLAACRTQGEVFSIPPFDLTPHDIDGFLDELRTFHGQFRSCFARSEPRKHFFNYMVGQFADMDVGAFLSVTPENPRGGKSTRADRVAVTHFVGDDPALTHVHGGGCPRSCGVGTAVQSPGGYCWRTLSLYLSAL